jgi:hypothetical protein
LSRQPNSDLTRQAVLLSAEGYRAAGKIPLSRMASLPAELDRIYANDESAAVHSAAEWLLRRSEPATRPQELSPRSSAPPGSGWWVTASGHALVRVGGPVDFQIGSPKTEPRRDEVEGPRSRRIDHSYAIASHEVTVDQFLRFFPDHPVAWDVAPTPNCPVNNVSWYDAARYCRRLSEAEGVPETEMVYPRVEDIDPGRGLVLPADWQRRTGYRLPTEAEWEYACRAGTTTARFYGTTDDALSRYGWWMGNADSRCWPVGSLRPNPFGLFDVLGNVGEWCFDPPNPYSDGAGEAPPEVRSTQPRTFRGGYYQLVAKDLRSAKRNLASPTKGFSYNGFRVVRTLRTEIP